MIIILLLCFAPCSPVVYNTITSTEQQFTVPGGMDTMIVEIYGARGGHAAASFGGNGAKVQAIFSVVPGTTYYYRLGNYATGATGGYNGGGQGGTSGNSGGGGGASDIRTIANDISSRIIVAGGGGGAHTDTDEHGGSGGQFGNMGWGPTGESGYGGTQSAGGAGGCQAGNCGTAGTLGIGGAAAGGGQFGGGGGGGYYGGGGGNSAGGGGGSSFVHHTGRNVIYTTGACSTSGSITVEFILSTTSYSTITSSQLSFVVPSIYTLMTVDLYGSQGESGGVVTGGKGGHIRATFTVTPGQTYYYNLGSPTYNGGGLGGTIAGQKGGGATDLRASSDSNLAARIMVAAGGGGSMSGDTQHGGAGGGLVGINGGVSNNGGGYGATQIAGGLAGCVGADCGTAGSLGIGGNAYTNYGGGGGGGYYGGGGGRHAGGGGSSFVARYGTSVSHVTGAVTGTGHMTVAFSSLTFTTVTSQQEFFVVPPGMNTMFVDMYGARGGSFGFPTPQGGFGARVQATFTVVPGTIYYYNIGGKAPDVYGGVGGYNGGGNGGSSTGNKWGAGGGGATDIRTASTLESRIIVAGGGGGSNGGYPAFNGGAGGRIGEHGAGAGMGATQSAGGAGYCNSGVCGTDGVLGQGGSAQGYNGCGGGGGYYGGGGATFYPGGGGSSYVDPTGYSVTYTTGAGSGDGQLSVTFAYAAPPTSQPSKQPSSTPSQQPRSQPTRQPTQQPVCTPSTQPTRQPSTQPSTRPSSQPSCQPSIQPRAKPSMQPSKQPSWKPSCQPMSIPSSQPSRQPSYYPSSQPFALPSSQPSRKPLAQPSSIPSSQPSNMPTSSPSCQPSKMPTIQPMSIPSRQPLSEPTTQPIVAPSCQPTLFPSIQPSLQPSMQPSSHPSHCPSSSPLLQPTATPTIKPSSQPSVQPFDHPTSGPSTQPVSQPSSHQSTRPSVQPSVQPSFQPLICPTIQPTCQPSTQPVALPSSLPSFQPINTPSQQPSLQPTLQIISTPTSQPSLQPISLPTGAPSNKPRGLPSSQPSRRPSTQPVCSPTSCPSCVPSRQPSSDPSRIPTDCPSAAPSCQPSTEPTLQPVLYPSSSPSVQPTSSPSQIRISNDTDPLLPSIRAISVRYMSEYALPFKIVLPFRYTDSVSGDQFIDITVPMPIAGVSYILSGSGFRGAKSLSVSSMMLVSPAIAYDFTGRSVCNAGDVNDDGFDDLIIGVPYASKVYVLYGNSRGFVDMSEGFTIFGADPSDLTGWSVSGAGDVNNDTITDIIIGAPNANDAAAGVVYILFGTLNRQWNVHLNKLSSIDGFIVFGVMPQDSLGVSVSDAGDVNGDGIDDIIFSALKAIDLSAGSVYVLYGNGTSPFHSALSLATSSSGFTISGAAHAWLGCSVSKAGDVNNDGYADLIVGSTPRKRPNEQQISYLIYGGLALTDFKTSTLTSTQGVIITGGGAVVAGLGDVDHDGVDDVMIGSGYDFSTGGGFVFTLLQNLTITAPSITPTAQPTHVATHRPSIAPTIRRSTSPSVVPSLTPTQPTELPTIAPTGPTFAPSVTPTQPSSRPSSTPTAPSQAPTRNPVLSTTVEPSQVPSAVSTTSLCPSTYNPSCKPSHIPSLCPTRFSIVRPTTSPTKQANITYITTFILSGGVYARNTSNLHFIVNTTENTVISGAGGIMRVTVIANALTVLQINQFNQSTDVVDLTDFRSINSFTSLNLTDSETATVLGRRIDESHLRTSVLIHLPKRQLIIMANTSISDLSERNFILAQPFEKVPDIETMKDSWGSVIIGCTVCGSLLLYMLYEFRVHILRGILKKSAIDWDKEEDSNPTFVKFDPEQSDQSIDFSDISTDSSESSRSNLSSGSDDGIDDGVDVSNSKDSQNTYSMLISEISSFSDEVN